MQNQAVQTGQTAARRHRWYFYPGILLLVLVLLFGAFLTFLTVAEYRPQPVEPALTGGSASGTLSVGEPLRILTYNTGYASLGRDASFLMDGGQGTGTAEKETVLENQDGIAAILAAADADIYMIQEIDQASSRTYDENQLEIYGSVLPEHQWAYAPNFFCRFVPYPLQHPFGRIDSGVATYSRYPLDEAQRISLPNPFSWPIRTANLKRCMLATWLPLEDTDAQLVIVNFHLEAYDDGAGKQAQTDQLLALMQQEYEKGNYVIAGGDFNQIFPDVETVVKPTSEWVPGDLDPLPEDWDGWQYVYDDTAPTCRLLNQPYQPDDALTQYYVIDGFIVSPNLMISQVETQNEHFQFSDHNPVCMEVVLMEGAA